MGQALLSSANSVSSEQTQENAAKAEQEREHSHRMIRENLFKSSAKLAALITAGILVLLFVLGLLGRFVIGVSHGTSADNPPLWDVVGISNFILPGAWAFILISGVSALIYGAWKLYDNHRDTNVTTYQRYQRRL